MGLLLFILFLTDQSIIAQKQCLTMYADDTTYSKESKYELPSEVEGVMDNILIGLVQMN